MKTMRILILLTVLGTGAWLYAQNQADTNAPAPGAPPPPPAVAAPPTNAPAPPPVPPPAAPAEAAATTAAPSDTNAPPPATEAAVTNTPPPTVILPNGELGLRINFRGAPLETVLNYLSDAAGFIIVVDAQVRGKVDMWSATPVSKDEAINLLNSVLNKNGYAAIRNDRTLTIVNKDEAKTKSIPVKQGGNPEDIPRNDEIVTQIIPVRTVEATALLKDIQPLVSSTTTMTANEAGNSIIVTDTQANIRRIAEVIKAVDIGADEETLVRVFPLKFADPTEMANQISGIFPDETRTSNSQASSRFGGFRSMFGGRGGGGPFGGNPFGGGDNGSSNNQRIKKKARVIAVADPRTSSVIVTAGKDLMDQIAGMIEQLDSSPAKKQKVYVYSLDNADADEVEQVLSDMFERNTSSQNRNRNSSTQNNALRNRSTQNQQNSRSSGMGTFGGSSMGGGGRSGGGF